jgi:uncharacterized protein (DUF1015 family)
LAKITPFKAVRPVRNKAHLICSRPFYTYQKTQLKSKLESNPYSFLHVINPEFKQSNRSKPNSTERFELIKNKYQEFKKNKFLVKDKKPIFYLYRQTTNYGVFTGIIAGACVKDYQENKIKKHENIIDKRKKVFKKYLDICNFHAEPVLLAYQPSNKINEIVQSETSKRPEYEFTTTDKKSHELWLIDGAKKINEIINEFEKLNNIYIADGHHRIASSSLFQKSNPKHKKGNYFLSLLINQNDLKIFEFNRIVKNFGMLSKNELINHLKSYFEIKKLKIHQSPSNKSEVCLYIKSEWYLLKVKPEALKNDMKSSLNSQIVSDLILKRILNIENLSSNSNIEFIKGNQPIDILSKRVDQNNKSLGIELFPHKIEEITSIADRGENMPPKSTWIEPKLRSGLIIYEY